MKSTIGAALISMLIATTAQAENCDTPQDELEALALNIYHESRGEDPDAQQMVGEVVLNRMESVNYPDDVCAVIYAESQFSWTNKKDKTPYEKEEWQKALILADELLSGEIEYFDNGATHFINPDEVQRMPTWTRKFKTVGRMGDHVFYADGSVKKNMFMPSSAI